MPEYVKRESIALAIQFKNDNANDVIDWIQHLNFQFSYDEIRSGGHLIVYDILGKPFIVGEDWWIVFHYDNIFVMDDETFNSKFILRSV